MISSEAVKTLRFRRLTSNIGSRVQIEECTSEVLTILGRKYHLFSGGGKRCTENNLSVACQPELDQRSGPCGQTLPIIRGPEVGRKKQYLENKYH